MTNGTIFEISSDGAFTNLYLFHVATMAESQWRGITQGIDGNFYGTHPLAEYEWVWHHICGQS